MQNTMMSYASYGKKLSLMLKFAGGQIDRVVTRGHLYYSTIQISFSDLKKEIGNHSVISNFHFQFENENQKIGSIFRFSFIVWN